MKLALKVFGVIVVILLTLIVGGYAYLGGFSEITITENDMGPFHFVYRGHAGTDFSKVGEMATVLDHDLRGKGFQSLRPFVLFYPEGGGEVGFVVEETDTLLFNSLDSSIRVKTIPRQLCLVTTFPWKNSLSYVVGYGKVDNALGEYRRQNKYKKTWAATLHAGDSIAYIQPAVKSKD